MSGKTFQYFHPKPRKGNFFFFQMHKIVNATTGFFFILSSILASRGKCIKYTDFCHIKHSVSGVLCFLHQRHLSICNTDFHPNFFDFRILFFFKKTCFTSEWEALNLNLTAASTGQFSRQEDFGVLKGKERPLCKSLS